MGMTAPVACWSGPCVGLHPLENDAFHGAHPKAEISLDRNRGAIRENSFANAKSIDCGYGAVFVGHVFLSLPAARAVIAF